MTGQPTAGRVIPLGEVLPRLPPRGVPPAEGEPPRPAAGGGPAAGPSAAEGWAADAARFLDRTARGLSANAVAVWLLLRRHARGRAAVAGVGFITQHLRLGERTVERALHELRGAGLAVQVRRGRPGAGVSVYRLRAERPAGAAHPPPAAG